jgi:uncharacterized protein (DUF58 family)
MSVKPASTTSESNPKLLPLATLALLALVTVIFRLGLLTYATYAIVGLFWSSRWLARVWAESISVKRECMRKTAEVGQTVPVSVTIQNTGKWPVGWVLVEDLLPREALIHEPPRLRVAGERLQLTMLRSGQSRSMYFQLQCNRRGYYQIGPTVVETGDLFGLHRRYRIGVEPDYLLVYPEVLPIEGYEIASRRPIGEVRLTHRLFEDPTRIAGVRAYQAGDPLNRVHWRATARTGVLHSKVYEASTVAGATLLLDFHREAHDPRHEPVRSELAITAAASLANCLYQLGHQVGLVTNGRDAADRIRSEGFVHDWRTRGAAQSAVQMNDQNDRLRPIVVPTRQGPDQFRNILETLARLELTDGLAFPELVNETDDRLPRDATLVAILPRVTPRDAIALGNLRRRGYAVTAAINLYDEYEFASAAGPLIANGVDVRHLKDRDSIRSLCRRFALG